MTQYLDTMKPGDKIDVRGPSGRLKYVGNGTFEITVDKKSPPTIKKAQKLGMIAGSNIYTKKSHTKMELN